jgi:hypothetical protein
MNRIALLSLTLIILTGCTSGTAKFAREMAKNPATISFSAQIVTPWGQQNISFARSGTNNAASAKAGEATVNQK